MKLFLISIILVFLTMKYNFQDALPVFGKEFIEGNFPKDQLAIKYCDSLEKKIFKGLDQESILKYEYFFSSIPDDFINDENKFLEIFKSDVKSICLYEVSESNEKEFKSFLKNYFKTKSSTPKTKVEAINPTPINTAIIPVLR